MIKYIRNRYDLIDSNSAECIVLEEHYDVDEYWGGSVAPRNYTWLDAKIIISLSNHTIVLHSETEEDLLNKLSTMMHTVSKWINKGSWVWQSAHPQSSDTVKIARDVSKSIDTISIMRTVDGDMLLSFNDCTQLGTIRISDSTYPHLGLQGNLQTILNNLSNALSDMHLRINTL